MQLLPTLLTQEYEAEYEVIVVDMCDSRNTKDMLEPFEDTYPHLHHTFCPPTARDISLQRLALSLGAKAANFEWIIFLSPAAHITPAWLAHLAPYCDETADAVLGTLCYEPGGGPLGKRIRFEHLWEQMTWLPYALRHTPYRTHSGCLCYRRSYFLSHLGFASSELLAIGAETLLVNHHVTKGRCHVALDPSSIVRLPLPTYYTWHRDQLYEMETAQHLRHALLPKMDGILQAVTFPIFTVSAITAAVLYIELPQIAAIMAVLWLILTVTEAATFSYNCRQIGIPTPSVSLPWLLLLLPFWSVSTWLRWLFTPKSLFRKKFV